MQEGITNAHAMEPATHQCTISGCILDEQENFFSMAPCHPGFTCLHTKNHYTIMDEYWLNRKLFLTGWSLSSMIYMPSLRISTLFWMDVGWTKNKILIGSLSSMTYMLSQ
jgi:hypothetical protein